MARCTVCGEAVPYNDHELDRCAPTQCMMNLRARVAELEAESKARGEILDAIQKRAGATWWYGALDRLTELEEDALKIAQALGISHEADGVASAPGPVEEQLAEIARLKAVDREVADREHYERSMAELAHDNQDGW